MAKCVFNQVASSCRLLLDEIGDKERSPRSPRSPVVYLEDASETEKTDQAKPETVRLQSKSSALAL